MATSSSSSASFVQVRLRLFLSACALLLLVSAPGGVSAAGRTLGAYLDATFGVGPYGPLDLRGLIAQRQGVGNVLNLAGLQLNSATTAELNRLQPLFTAEQISALDFRSVTRSTPAASKHAVKATDAQM